MRQTICPLTVKWALQKILPYPCKQHYISVTLIPETNRFRLLKHQIKTQLKEKYSGRYSKVYTFLVLSVACDVIFYLLVMHSLCADCGQSVEGFCHETSKMSRFLPLFIAIFHTEGRYYMLLYSIVYVSIFDKSLAAQMTTLALILSMCMRVAYSSLPVTASPFFNIVIIKDP